MVGDLVSELVRGWSGSGGGGTADWSRLVWEGRGRRWAGRRVPSRVYSKSCALAWVRPPFEEGIYPWRMDGNGAPHALSPEETRLARRLWDWWCLGLYRSLLNVR